MHRAIWIVRQVPVDLFLRQFKKIMPFSWTARFPAQQIIYRFRLFAKLNVVLGYPAEALAQFFLHSHYVFSMWESSTVLKVVFKQCNVGFYKQDWLLYDHDPSLLFNCSKLLNCKIASPLREMLKNTSALGLSNHAMLHVRCVKFWAMSCVKDYDDVTTSWELTG